MFLILIFLGREFWSTSFSWISSFDTFKKFLNEVEIFWGRLSIRKMFLCFIMEDLTPMQIENSVMNSHKPHIGISQMQ